MKAYTGSRGTAPLIPSLCAIWNDQLDAPVPLVPGKNPSTHRIGGKERGSSRSGGFREERTLLLLPRFEPRIIKPVVYRVKEQRNILHEIHKRKENWIGHILRRNCLLQRVTEGKIKGGIEVTGRLGRRRRKLMDDLKERRGYSHFKEEALDRTIWTGRLGIGFRPVVRQTTK